MFLMLITIGTGLLIASIADFTKYIKFRKRGCLTEGTIVDATTVCAETMKVYNSKWATISYKVDGKIIAANSSNRVVGCGSYVEKYFLRANIMNTQRWILCPICGNKTRVMIRDDTELMNFPLFCPKCKKEVIINVKDNHITTVREPDASTQSR